MILCPVGPYFATGGFNPVSLHADPSVVRAFQGGCGNYKMGANYGPTIKPHTDVSFNKSFLIITEIYRLL